MNKLIYIYLSMYVVFSTILESDTWAMVAEEEPNNVQRKSFIPPQKKIPTPIKYRQNPSKENLKMDKERSMPYYGRNLSDTLSENSSSSLEDNSYKIVVTTDQSITFQVNR